MSDKKSEAKDMTFYKVSCDLYEEITIKFSKKAARLTQRFLPIAISSKASIKEGIIAVKKSPFQTVFVIDPETGKPLFALSQNEEFVEATHKKGGGGERPPLPPSPSQECCDECMSRGASGCIVLETMDCYCLYEGDGGKGNINDPLEVLGSGI